MRDKRLGQIVRETLRDEGFLIVERPRFLHLPATDFKSNELFAYEGLCDTKHIESKMYVSSYFRHGAKFNIEDQVKDKLRIDYSRHLATLLFDD